MPRPDLQQLARWFDPTLIALLKERRLQKKECCRHRKLGTLETLWLMLAVSLNAQCSSLHEILLLATGQLAIRWSISVAAFCKARAHFPPQHTDLAVWPARIAAAGGLQRRA
jgi:hypothetical protein